MEVVVLVLIDYGTRTWSLQCCFSFGYLALDKMAGYGLATFRMLYSFLWPEELHPQLRICSETSLFSKGLEREAI